MKELSLYQKIAFVILCVGAFTNTFLLLPQLTVLRLGVALVLAGAFAGAGFGRAFTAAGLDLAAGFRGRLAFVFVVFVAMVLRFYLAVQTSKLYTLCQGSEGVKCKKKINDSVAYGTSPVFASESMCSFRLIPPTPSPSRAWKQFTGIRGGGRDGGHRRGRLPGCPLRRRRVGGASGCGRSR